MFFAVTSVIHQDILGGKSYPISIIKEHNAERKTRRGGERKVQNTPLPKAKTELRRNKDKKRKAVKGFLVVCVVRNRLLRQQVNKVRTSAHDFPELGRRRWKKWVQTLQVAKKKRWLLSIRIRVFKRISLHLRIKFAELFTEGLCHSTISHRAVSVDAIHQLIDHFLLFHIVLI